MITQTPRFGGLKLSGECAVCDPSGGLLSIAGPRDRIVMKIMGALRLTGQYSPGGVQQFWTQFRNELCGSCQSKLDGLESSKRQAVALLEEAVRLDGKHEAAKKNLAALRGQR